MTGDSEYTAGSDSRLSDEDGERYKEVGKHFKEPLRSAILEDGEFVAGLTEEELLTFICVVSPGCIDDTEVRDRIERDRVRNAVSMLEKGKITASQAARVAGMGYYEFEDHLRKSGMRWKSRERPRRLRGPLHGEELPAESTDVQRCEIAGGGRRDST